MAAVPSLREFRRMLALMTEEQRLDFVGDIVKTPYDQTAALFDRWRLRLSAEDDGRRAHERPAVARSSLWSRVRPSRRPDAPTGPMRGFLGPADDGDW